MPDTNDEVKVTEPGVETGAKAKKVPFNKEQMDVIQQMLAEVREASNNRSSVDTISMYNMRDPKSIETVNVKRIDGKYVLGFKDFQKDSFKKIPKYLVYKADPTRGLFKEPFITLMLSEDGEEIEEREMMLVDYMSNREYYKARCLKVNEKEVIEDHGVLGSTGEYAVAVDDKGMPTSRPTILAQTKRTIRTFMVELPTETGKFDYEFIADFLA